MDQKIKCPVCGSAKYRYKRYDRFEEYGDCRRCGYSYYMCYSDPIEGHTLPFRRGRKVGDIYVPKNIRKRNRLRRRFHIRYDDNSKWLLKL